MTPEDKFKIPRPSKKLLSKLESLVDAVEDLYARGSSEAEEKLHLLNSFLAHPVSFYDVMSYSGVESCEEFLRGALTPDPYRHKNLTDEELLWLIRKVQDVNGDQVARYYYASILELNTWAPTGSVVSSVLPDEDPVAVLARLRSKDHVIHL